MDVEDLKRLLPRNLENRFTSLSTYVRSIIEVEQQENRRFRDLSNEQISFIQLVVFVYTLNGFLRTGTAAARNATIIFKKYNGEGFRIGSKIFTEDNENTMLGENLAVELQRSISQLGMDAFLEKSSSIRELIIRIVENMNNG